MGAVTFTVTPDDSNVYAAMSPKYHCKPAFTITPNYSLSALSAASKTALLDAISISNSSGVSTAWDNNNIRVTCSTNLAADAHTLSMDAVNFTGITVTPFDVYNFTVLDTLTFAVTPNAGNIYTALSPKYHCRPSFTITPSFTLNEADKTNIENAVSVINSNVTSKAWNGENNLIVTFSQNLTPNTSYTLTMGNVSGMDNVNISAFSNQAFTTIPQLSFSITSANTNVFYSSKYHCNPTFTITPSFTLNSGDRSTIEDAISVSGVSSSNLSKTWNGNKLTLGFNQYIATDTYYTVSMAAINNLTGVNVTTFNNLSFTTIPDLIVTLATSTTTLVKKANSNTNVLDVNGKNFCYCSGSSFTISTNMTLNETNKAKLFGAISLTGIDSTLVNQSWNANKIAISFNDTLTASTSFSISMSPINDINGVTVKPFSTYNTATFYHQGKGTQANPFTIYTPAQLACLDLYPKQAYFYKQMEDLDLSGYANWKPIGSSTSALRFCGKYDGNYKTISNAVINFPDYDYVGLFAYTTSSVFSNLTIENIEAHGHNKVGALAGSSSSSNTFTNINGDYLTVTGNDAVGGVWGESSGSSISNSEFNHIEVNAANIWIGNVIGLLNGGSITDCSVLNSSVKGRCYVGGYIGEAYGNGVFTNVVCDNVTVTSTGATSGDTGLGGFCGYCINSEKNNCSVINSRVLGAGLASNCGGFVGELGKGYKDISRNCVVRNTNITSKGTAGGFVGDYYVSEDTSNIISECIVENSSVSGGSYTGGFIGSNNNSNGSGIHESNVVNTTITSTGSVVGGFIGSSTCNLTSCYVASISMDTSGNYIGGLAGYASGNITSCYSEKAKIKGRLHSVGGLVGYLSPIGNVDNCHVSNANIVVDDVAQNRQCYGGLVGQSAGTINRSYVYKSSIVSFQQVGGLVGYVTGGSISKSFIKETTVSGYNFDVGGITATLFSPAQVDSCYIKDSSISFSVQASSNNYTLGGMVGSNTAAITNCYMYNSTVSGKTNYGALIGSNEGSGSITNCFITNNYSRLIDNNVNNTPLTYCFYNVNGLAAFNGQSWANGAWSNFDTSVFPPKLADLPEP